MEDGERVGVMMKNDNNILNCHACGDDFHFASGFANAADKTFCSMDCVYHIGRTTKCVSRFSVAEEIRGQEFSNMFYTCDTLQLGTQTLKVGEKIVGEDGKPAIHLTQTHAISLFRGSATVTIFQDNKPYPLELYLGRGAGDSKNIMVIPPGVPHIIENTGLVPLIMLSIYSPPTLDVC